MNNKTKNIISDICLFLGVGGVILSFWGFGYILCEPLGVAKALPYIRLTELLSFCSFVAGVAFILVSVSKGLKAPPGEWKGPPSMALRYLPAIMLTAFIAAFLIEETLKMMR